MLHFTQPMFQSMPHRSADYAATRAQYRKLSCSPHVVPRRRLRAPHTLPLSHNLQPLFCTRAIFRQSQ